VCALEGRREREGAITPSARPHRIYKAALFAVMTIASSLPVRAQSISPITREIGIDQRLDQQLPLDLQFRDETGKTVRLSEYFGRKPVILTFAYYECPMLCTLVLNGTLKAMRAISLDLGTDFEAVNISINPRETPALAAAKRELYVREYGRPGAEDSWHFLTGDEASIHRATQAAGYRYVYDPRTGLYSHASGIMVLTPDGKFARYFYGLEYSARDLRLGLVEAASGRIGSPVDQVLLLCFHYDPISGKYGLLITRVIQVVGTATALALGGLIFVMFRRDRSKPAQQTQTS
jgi:protein SCO1/2